MFIRFTPWHFPRGATLYAHCLNPLLIIRRIDFAFWRYWPPHSGTEALPSHHTIDHSWLAHSINPQLRDAMAELTCGDHRQALEFRDAMPYVMQSEAHENVYEYKRHVVRLFEGS
jgi:hypothetical protein